MEPEDLDPLVAAVHAYVALTGAPKATAFLDAGEGEEPVVVECPAGGPISVAAGERAIALARPPDAPVPALPPLRALEPVAAEDARAGRGLEDAAAGLRGLAELLPGRSVVTVELPGEEPVLLAARRGEPVIAAVGEDQVPLA